MATATRMLGPAGLRSAGLMIVLGGGVGVGSSFAQGEPTAAAVDPLTSTAGRPAWLSLSVGLEYRDQRDQTPAVTVEPLTGRVAGDAMARRIANTSFGLGSNPDAIGITRFDASLGYLSRVARGLVPEERRMVLSVIGERLQNGYSVSVENNPQMESIFQNARNGGREGGVCGDIHTYLSRVAPSLGFEAAGTHTGYWWIDERSGGGHAVAHFRDPSTGKYYMQNYTQLHATGQSTLQNLVEVSTRILGIAWASSVESLPGSMHLYVPKPARWVSTLARDQASASVHEPMLNFALSNRDQTGAIQYGWATERQQIKGYAMYSRFAADEGNYEFGQLGASYTFRDSVAIGRRWLDEAGTAATFYAGAVHLGMPILRQAANPATLRPVQWRRSTSLLGLSMSGYLRQGQTTGTATLEMNETGLPAGARKELRVGVNHAFVSLPVSVSFERVWDEVDANGQPKTRKQVVAAYDRLGARVHHQVARSLTFGVNADVFALEGIESGAGSAFRLGIDATWQTRSAGAFTLADEWGGVLDNPNGDPFYDLPRSHYATLTWHRPVGGRAAVHVQAGYGNGPSVQPFGTFGALSPELNDGSRQLAARVSVRFAY